MKTHITGVDAIPQVGDFTVTCSLIDEENFVTLTEEIFSKSELYSN